jgi:hypothetical protein
MMLPGDNEEKTHNVLGVEGEHLWRGRQYGLA